MDEVSLVTRESPAKLELANFIIPLCPVPSISNLGLGVDLPPCPAVAPYLELPTSWNTVVFPDTRDWCIWWFGCGGPYNLADNPNIHTWGEHRVYIPPYLQHKAWEYDFEGTLSVSPHIQLTPFSVPANTRGVPDFASWEDPPWMNYSDAPGNRGYCIRRWFRMVKAVSEWLESLFYEF